MSTYAQIDPNGVKTGIAWDGTNPQTLTVDAATSRLLIEIAEISAAGSLGTSDIAQHDQNNVTTSMGVTDDANFTLSNLRATVDGYLLVDIIPA